MRPFVPYFRNPHLATIAGNYWRRDLDEQRFPVQANYYATEPGVQVLVHSQQPLLEKESEPIAQLILVHGLEGSSAAGYACSLAQAALVAGCAVYRFNMRSCGGTEHLSGGTLYHSGQTSDLLYFLRQLPRSAPIFLAGFSLGGNVSLKLAGELGASAGDLLAGVMAVSTPMDLAACVRQIDRPSNIVYARRFVSRLKERVRIKARHRPGFFDLSRLDEVRSIYQFDDRITAQVFGFGSADNYYATQSANQFLDRIRVPTLLVQAKDDPMIPFEVYDHPAFAANPHLRLIATDHGGHLGFIARSRPRFWLDGVLVNWLLEVRNKPRASFVSHI